MLNFDSFQVLTFDCYGTLVDWESGILAALRPILADHGKSLSDRQILELYSDLERQQESGPYLPYRRVLEEVVRGFGQRLAFSVSLFEARSLPESLKNWKPFPDTVPALRALKSRYRLGIISNIDDDLFADTARHLQVSFDWVVTAQQASSYKPSPNNFQMALGRMGVPPEQWLHVAESLHHDIAPARALGIAGVWVNRRAARAGASASGSAEVQPDLEVPDLKTLAEMALAARPAG